MINAGAKGENIWKAGGLGLLGGAVSGGFYGFFSPKSFVSGGIVGTLAGGIGNLVESYVDKRFFGNLCRKPWSDAAWGAGAGAVAGSVAGLAVNLSPGQAKFAPGIFTCHLETFDEFRGYINGESGGDSGDDSDSSNEKPIRLIIYPNPDY